MYLQKQSYRNRRDRCLPGSVSRAASALGPGWPMPGAGGLVFFQVGTRAQVPGSSFAFPGMVTVKLKWSSENSDWCPCGLLVFQAAA